LDLQCTILVTVQMPQILAPLKGIEPFRDRLQILLTRQQSRA